MKGENVISWNLPNLITVVLMMAVLWAALGLGSSLVRSRSKTNRAAVSGVASDGAGNLVQQL